MAVRVQAEDFDPGHEMAAIAAGRPGIGGVASFVGLVRDLHLKGPEAGDRVQAMTLEHYPGMTQRMLEAIESEARSRWPLEDVQIIHRFGRLLPGDRIVLVICASAHRDAAFDACRFLMDWLKTKAPFWKLEETAEGERWVAQRPEDDEAAALWEKGRAEVPRADPSESC